MSQLERFEMWLMELANSPTATIHTKQMVRYANDALAEFKLSKHFNEPAMSDIEMMSVLDGLYAYDSGCTDSGVSHGTLRQRVINEIKAVDRAGRIGATRLRELAREMWLSDSAVTQGYGLQDMLEFMRWIDDRLCPGLVQYKLSIHDFPVNSLVRNFIARSCWNPAKSGWRAFDCPAEATAISEEVLVLRGSNWRCKCVSLGETAGLFIRYMSSQTEASATEVALTYEELFKEWQTENGSLPCGIPISVGGLC